MMKYGAQNNNTAKIKTIKTGDMMSQVKHQIIPANVLSYVLTTDFVRVPDPKTRDTANYIVK